jgi:hypothetical protein
MRQPYGIKPFACSTQHPGPHRDLVRIQTYPADTGNKPGCEKISKTAAKTPN